MAPFGDWGQGSLATMERSFMSSFEVKENKEGYLFKADMPGVNLSGLKA